VLFSGEPVHGMANVTCAYIQEAWDLEPIGELDVVRIVARITADLGGSPPVTASA